jgi:hypothetical protein
MTSAIYRTIPARLVGHGPVASVRNCLPVEVANQEENSSEL